MSMTKKMHICLNTADDRELHVEVPSFAPLVAHRVMLNDLEYARGLILVNEILVDGEFVDGLATVKSDGVFVQFFENMPTVSVLTSLLSALHVVQTEYIGMV